MCVKIILATLLQLYINVVIFFVLVLFFLFFCLFFFLYNFFFFFFFFFCFVFFLAQNGCKEDNYSQSSVYLLRYNDGIRYNDILTGTKPYLKG